MELIIIRGLPGSGKSTKAREYEGYIHAEADAYFVGANGEYTFNPAKLGQAHAWCLGVVTGALMAGVSATVSNTFTMRWEYQGYIDIAERLGAEVKVLTMKGEWGNVHGVPAETIEKMRARWEE